ncbi:MAG: molybdopterin-dependent oxidoreductase [Candidatus Bathyarchaeota archaeon]|nr:molybdopterin-dependent oxidoreductase [Candidatus Bathyarchaeum sp.]
MDKKIIAIATVIIVIVAAVASWQLLLQPNQDTIDLEPLTLTVIGVNGEQVVLDENNITDIESITSPGGYKTSGGLIALVGNFTGIPISSLLDLVGGMTSDSTLTITASDGYSMVFTYDQISGKGYNTYDPVNGSEVSSDETLTLMVNYLCNGEVLPEDKGPLRMAIVGSSGLLTEGHFWVKYVSQIQVTPNVRDWTVAVCATADLYMDRQAYTADFNHFGISWTDDSGDVWTGTALWRWVSWSNYNGGVSNQSLDAGYQVELVSGDGYSVIIDDSIVKMNDNIIVASHLNAETLPNPYWPLTLVGSELSSSESIKNIVQMNILLDAESNDTSSDAWTLTVNGTNAVDMSQGVFETQVSSVSASWTDDDGDVWTGTPLCRIVDWGMTNGVISSEALADGYVVKVMAGDGYTVILDGARIEGNSNIFIANQINGEALSGSSYPLKLTGPDLSKKESVKGVAQVEIMPLSMDMSLTLVAANGTEVVLSATDIAGLDSYTAGGGTRSSSGSIKNIGTYTGVPILTLLDLVGGVSTGDTVTVTASDGYASSVTYEQLNGQDIATYGAEGNPVEANETLTMIVAYHLDGAILSAEDVGNLRIAVVGPEGVITSGSVWAKFVVEIEIVPAE